METNYKHWHYSATFIGLLAIVILSVGALAGTLVLATEIILVLFLGILFSVLLSRLSHLLAYFTPLDYFWSLAAVTILLLTTGFGIVAVFGVQLESKISATMDHAEEGIEQLVKWAGKYPTVNSVLLSTPFVSQWVDKKPTKSDKEQSEERARQESKSSDTSSVQLRKSDPKKDSSSTKLLDQSLFSSTAKRGAMAVAGIFQSSLGIMVNGLLIFFTGLFLAIDPGMYRDGCVKLFPEQHRERTREIMDLMGNTLWDWLLGQFCTMTITGTGAALLLWAIGVPMAFTLGTITALLTFIPNIGPALALILALLFAIPQGSMTILYVLIGYVGLQLVESYVITPLIQQKQAALPPALQLAAQALMGVLCGLLGATVAPPLLAVVKVGVEEAYVKDVLENTANS